MTGTTPPGEGGGAETTPASEVTSDRNGDGDDHGHDVASQDLATLEAVIERGIATFMEVGAALTAIRNGKKYRDAGYRTFTDYCDRRWGFTTQHAGNLMRSAEIVAQLETETTVSVLPTKERQVRALGRLRDDPEVMQEAWNDAVAAAGGKQPTIEKVEIAVARRQPKPRYVPPKPPKPIKVVQRNDHPAPFSDAVLAAVGQPVRGVSLVLDPYAGTGRIHELRELAGVKETIGIEIEEWEGMHPDNQIGNALALPFDDGSIPAIATSPTFGNRMADHHDARDDGDRVTYKHRLGRDLHPDNSGGLQWGPRYRDHHVRAWTEAVRVLEPGGLFVLNIKDHIRRGKKQEVSAWHVRTLTGLGLHPEAVDVIETDGVMAGENADARVPYEFVFTFSKPKPTAAKRRTSANPLDGMPEVEALDCIAKYFATANVFGTGAEMESVLDHVADAWERMHRRLNRQLAHQREMKEASGAPAEKRLDELARATEATLDGLFG